MAMALLRPPGDLTMRTLMTFDTSEMVYKKVVLGKNIFILFCSSLSHCRNDEELSLFPQIIDSEVYNVYFSSSRISYAPIGFSHCD